MPFLSHNRQSTEGKKSVYIKMNKVLRDANTARWLRRRQKFLPRRRPPSRGARSGPKFNQLEMVTTFTYKPSLVRSMHAISSYRGNRPTNTLTNTQTHAVRPLQTRKHTDRTDYNTLCHSFASALRKYVIY